MEMGLYFQSIVSLLFVIALIGGLAMLAKHFGFGKGVPRLGKTKRLSIVEAINVDGRHRAVLLRRDDVEHLVMISQNSDILIETNIPTPSDSDLPAPDLSIVNKDDS